MLNLTSRRDVIVGRIEPHIIEYRTPFGSAAGHIFELSNGRFLVRRPDDGFMQNAEMSEEGVRSFLDGLPVEPKLRAVI
jgi:hypothetical protein